MNITLDKETTKHLNTLAKLKSLENLIKDFELDDYFKKNILRETQSFIRWIEDDIYRTLGKQAYLELKKPSE